MLKTTKSGSLETLTLPEGGSGHYLQIRVLQGSGGFASIADILIDTISSYDTPQGEHTCTATRLMQRKTRKRQQKRF